MLLEIGSSQLKLYDITAIAMPKTLNMYSIENFRYFLPFKYCRFPGEISLSVTNTQN